MLVLNRVEWTFMRHAERLNLRRAELKGWQAGFIQSMLPTVVYAKKNTLMMLTSSKEYKTASTFIFCNFTVK